MTTQRRPRAWSDILINRSITAGSSSIALDLLVDAPTIDTRTVIRIIGDIGAFPDDRNAAIDGVMEIDMGIGVCSREAFVANVVPDPNVQAEYPSLGWLYITTQLVVQNNASGTIESFLYPQWHFDVGANRKVDKGTLYAAINNTTADDAGFTVRVVGRLRALCLT